MSNPKKLVKNLKASDENVQENTGIIPAKYHYDYEPDSLSSSEDDDELFSSYKDPVPAHNRNAIKLARPPRERYVEPKKDEPIKPSISVRLELERPADYPAGEKYKLPKPKGTKKAAKERRKDEDEARNFCEYDIVRIPSPTNIGYVEENVKFDSPKISKAKVVPQRPSVISNAIYPYPQTSSYLDTTKPKSGIFINEKNESIDETVSKEERVKKEKTKESQSYNKSEVKTEVEEEELLTDYLDNINTGEGVDELPVEQATSVVDELRIRKQCSYTSKQTSINSKDVDIYEDLSWGHIPLMTRLVQTFRNENDLPEKKKIKKGTLESHSFTSLKQKVPKEFCFQTTIGSINQGNENFSITSRNRQGICMPVAAFCYAALYPPKTWTLTSINDILEIGDMFYLDCIAELHVHRHRKEVMPHELNKYIYLEDKRIKFKIDEPEINGCIRTKDKLVYNIYKGLRLFFKKHDSGLVQSKDLNVVIWRHRKYFYLFDAVARRKDLYRDSNGTAILAVFQELSAVAAVLLHRTELGESLFTISEIEVLKILGKDEIDVDDVVDARSIYNILSEKKAVVLGNFELGDRCFEFTRNKQALAMATVALVYARITPPSAWRRKTLDKIMVIGNQLYKECADFECVQELRLQNLPAVFTLGPYICEIFVYAARFADTMYKKGTCVLAEKLGEYFEDSTNAIVQIGKSYLAVWQQRGLFYLFDPYSRNSDALNCRRGTCCVSMNADIETVLMTIMDNFVEEKDVVFYIHALKVIKIHRDPAVNRMFPKSVPLHDVPLENFRKVKLRKSRKKATEKPVKTNFTEYAMRKLLAGELPEGSILDVGSHIGSLADEYVPDFGCKARNELRAHMDEMDMVADLESPSLSDTQIHPTRPEACKGDVIITIQDLDSFDLTLEELELEDNAEEHEGEGEDGFIMGEGFDQQEDEANIEDVEKYFVNDKYSQVHSASLEDSPKMVTNEMNTDLSYQYKVLPALEYPPKSKRAKGVLIDIEAQKEEYEKKSNYQETSQHFQILRAKEKSIDDYNKNYDVLAPYIGIMATAYSQELPIHKWDTKHVEFILKAGNELYNTHQEEYHKITDFELEFHHKKLTAVIEKSLDTFIGKSLFNSRAGLKAIMTFLELHVFNDSDFGIVIINNYSWTVFLKRNLFYLYDCYTCNNLGVATFSTKEEVSTACVSRFKTLEELVLKILYNLFSWESDEDCGDYRKVVLLKPRFTVDGASSGKHGDPSRLEEDLFVTQSQELRKPSNFADLPDDSQIIRGSTDVSNFGHDVEFIAPFVCILASAVAAKYSINTWSSQVVDYVLKCGSEVYKKSTVRYDQVSKLEIPRISLGRTDYSVEVNYLIDAPMKYHLLESCLRKVLLKRDNHWAIVVTKTYACAAFFRNGLFYLFDAFPCNELGLCDGNNQPNGEGLACLTRYKNLKALAERIMHNKDKHEDGESVEYTKFVLSMCKATTAKKIEKKKIAKSSSRKKQPTDDTESEEYEDALDEEEEEEATKGARKKKAEEEPENKIGYQNKNGLWVIEGNHSLPGAAVASAELKEDHFVCLCACLMAVDKPIPKWDTKRVNNAVDQGRHVYSHADNIEVSEKRTIKNILVGVNFFDIIVKKVIIELWRDNKNVEIGLNTVLRRRKFALVQFPNCSYVVYKDEHCLHLFSPYQSTHQVEEAPKQNKDGKKEKPVKKTITCEAGWIRFKTDKKLKSYLTLHILQGCESYAFYIFDVINVRKAPKKFLLTHRIDQYALENQPKGELLGKPFHEKETWLHCHQSPWSRIGEISASGKPRGRGETRWHNWDIEYRDDLYSLIGGIHQTNRTFHTKNRGKQTLGNLVVAIGMTNIYEFTEWNSAVLDAILTAGDTYFEECTKGIKEDNYEMTMDDLKDSCSVFPYRFKVAYSPIVEGAMFVTNPRVFNLYKALRYFFEGYERRCGVLTATKPSTHPTAVESVVRRLVGFGKTGHNEYFMYDCQAYGPPMFSSRTGASYALRMLTQARLLHCLVVTVRGGDFYIHEVETFEFEPIP